MQIMQRAGEQTVFHQSKTKQDGEDGGVLPADHLYFNEAASHRGSIINFGHYK
jgi:hypothetical protein